MVEFLSFREGEVGQEPAVTVESFTGQSTRPPSGSKLARMPANCCPIWTGCRWWR